MRLFHTENPHLCPAFTATFTLPAPAETHVTERRRDIARTVLEYLDDADALDAYLEAPPQFEGRDHGDQRMTRQQVRLWLRARRPEVLGPKNEMPELIADAGGIWPDDRRRLT